MSPYGAYLVHNGIQSATLHSYTSAIKAMLLMVDYEWDDKKVLVNSLITACHLVNDRIKVRLPIQIELLEILPFELRRKFSKQDYLLMMY